jgi:hypothetical protein
MPNREPPRPRSRACKHSVDKTTVNEEERTFLKKDLELSSKRSQK